MSTVARKEYDVLRFDSNDDWLASRPGFIGSSEIAGLFGLGYASQSEYAIYAEKALGVKVPWDDETLKILNIGKMAEPLLRQVFEQETGKKIYWDDVPTVRVSRRWPVIGASIDSWIEPDDEEEVVETKFIGIHQRYEFANSVPHKHMLQIQHQLAATGWNRGWLFAMCANETFLHEVPRHEGIIEQIVNRSERFMARVARKLPPEIDGSEATAKVLLAQYPQPEPKSVVALDKTYDRFGIALERVKARKKRAEEIERELSSRIKAAIGNAELAYTPGGKAWSWGKRGKTRALCSVNANRQEILQHKVS